MVCPKYQLACDREQGARKEARDHAAVSKQPSPDDKANATRVRKIRECDPGKGLRRRSHTVALVLAVRVEAFIGAVQAEVQCDDGCTPQQGDLAL